jgi:hypothetical protein
MKVMQEMTDKELKKARRDAMTNLFLGADNSEAIDAFEDEINRRKHSQKG